MKKLSHGCTLDCADCCKFNVYIDKNEVVKIEGDEGFSIEFTIGGNL